MPPRLSQLDTGVYVITNTVNGKVYVGSAAFSLRARLRDHKSLLRRGVHGNKHLQSAWNKYGWSAFQFDVVERCLPERCIKREQCWIDDKGSASNKKGYNINPTAGSSLWRPNSEATRAKLSKAMKGREITWTDKLSDALKGRVISEETRAKISASLTGRRKDPAAVEKGAAKIRGRKYTEEHRTAIGNGRRGILHSEESKVKISAGNMGNKNHLGKPHTEESKRKMSLAHKAAYLKKKEQKYG